MEVIGETRFLGLHNFFLLFISFSASVNFESFPVWNGKCLVFDFRVVYLGQEFSVPVVDKKQGLAPILRYITWGSWPKAVESSAPLSSDVNGARKFRFFHLCLRSPFHLLSILHFASFSNPPH